MNNASIVKTTLVQVKGRIDAVIDNKMQQLANKLFEKMCALKFYSGFTGNTQRSYSVGYFMDGELRYFVNGTDKWSKNEISLKVKKGKKVYLEEPYEGKARTIIGASDVDDYYGFETAKNYIMSQPTLSKGWTIIAGVGTEYYQFINERNRTMNEDIDYILTQDDLWEHFIKQIVGSNIN